MNARDELFESMTPTDRYPAPGEAESVNALLDAYRAEVLAEAAAAIVLDRDTTRPSGGGGAYRRGLTRAVEIVKGLAGKDTGGAPATAEGEVPRG